MNCACHGQPAYWQKDARNKSGGWWECRVKRAAHNATRTTNAERRNRLTQRRKDQYDNDPVHRIEQRLRQDAAARQRRLERRREELHGPLPHEGRSRPRMERHPPADHERTRPTDQDVA